MRTYAIRTKVVIAVCSALGLLMAMREPWYGARPAPDPGADIGLQVTWDASTATLARWLRDPRGASAWQAFEFADVALAALALVAGVAALACLHPDGQRSARLVLQLSALAGCALIASTLVDQRGENVGAEPRYGLFVASALVVTLLGSAWGINACPLRRRRCGPASRGYRVR
jgi:hypothetical protein